MNLLVNIFSRALRSTIYLAFILSSISSSFATNYYVGTGGTDDANPGRGATSGDPYATIQYVLTNQDLNAGDSIILGAGTFSEDNITFSGDDEEFSIIGASMATTIFEGDGTDRFLTIDKDSITIQNITLKDYKHTTDDGGAITLDGGDGHLFEFVTFETCSTATNNGGAVYGNSCSATFNACVFKGNYSNGNGSAIHWVGVDSLHVNNCLFYDNLANANGEIYVENAAIVRLKNCTFTENGASGDGTVVFDYGLVYIDNCIFWNNATANDMWEAVANPVAVTNTFYENYKTTSLFDPYTITNCIEDVDPMFASVRHDDFRLMYASTARDAALLNTATAKDLNDYTRDGAPDIGTYEWYCTTEDAGIAFDNDTICNQLQKTLSAHLFEAKHLRWETSPDGGIYTPISGAIDSSEFSTPELTTTTYYRLGASCNNTDWAYSNVAKITILHENYFVSTTGNDGNGGASSGDAWATLNYAIGQANCGDTIDVLAGTYTEKDIVVADATKEIYVRGAGKTSTIFDSDLSNRWMTFSAGDNIKNFTITDMKIKDYKHPNDDGGALTIDGGWGYVFEDMKFENCSTSNIQHGGAVYGNTSAAIFNRCEFASNYSDRDGSAVYWEGTDSLIMINCLFRENLADLNGDVFILDDAVVRLKNCTFADNGASGNGTVCFEYGDAYLTNCIFWDNATTYDVWEEVANPVDMINCIYQNYQTNNAYDPFSLTNCWQNTDPLFASAVNDDYRLMYASPARDSSNITYAPSLDLDGQTRDAKPDLGAYEWDCTIPNGGIAMQNDTICSNSSYTLTGYDYVAKNLKWLSSTDDVTFSDMASGADVNSIVTPFATTHMYYKLAGSCDNTTWDTSSSVKISVLHSDYFVSTAGNDGNNGTSAGTAWATLSYAIANASCGDTIDVLTGTYTEDNITVADGTDEIYVRGAGQGSTIFDGDYTYRWMEFATGGNTEGVTFTNMTIKEMRPLNQNGGAVYINDAITGITFEDVTFETCSTGTTNDDGGAIYAEANVGLTIKRSTFKGCFADADGSAIYWSSGTCNIINSLFYDNVCNDDGDIYIAEGTVNVTNCTFTENLSTSGSVIYLYNGTCNAKNSLFYNNASTYDLSERWGEFYFDYCFTENNGTYSTNELYETNPVTGANPIFTNAAANDFSLTDASNGVDDGTNTGAPTDDITGTTRLSVANTVVDIGCYEVTSAVVCPAQHTWDGSASSSWTTAANWVENVVPCGNAIIINDETNDPIISTAVTCTDFTMNNAAILTWSTSDNITISGNLAINNSASINRTGSGVFEMTGATKTIQAAEGVSLTSMPLTVSGSITLTTNLSVEQLNVGATGIFTVDSGQKLTLEGDLLIDGIFTLSGTSTFDIKGDFTYNGTFNENFSNVNFVGTTAQLINGSANSTFSNLTINNTAGVTLSNPTTVSSDFTLIDGILTTTSSDILIMDNTINDNAQDIIGGSNSSYINGPVRIVGYKANGSSYLDSLVVPVGAGVYYSPVYIIPSSNGTNTWEVEYKDSPADGLSSGDKCIGNYDRVSSIDMFQIDRTSGSANAKLRFYWNSHSDVNSQVRLNDLVLAHYNSPTCWEVLDTDTSKYTRDWTKQYIETEFDVTDYSPFSFAAIEGLVQLPVELSTFTATLDDQKENVVLDWSTLSELNSAYFEVEKKTKGETFETITTVSAMGNSLIRNDYSSIDIASAGISNYRLKLVDINGAYAYSNVRTVGNNTSKYQLEIDYNQLIVRSNSQEEEQYSIRLIDVLGRVVVNQTFTTNQYFNLSSDYLGVFFVDIYIDQELISKKLILGN